MILDTKISEYKIGIIKEIELLEVKINFLQNGVPYIVKKDLQEELSFKENMNDLSYLLEKRRKLIETLQRVLAYEEDLKKLDIKSL